jgi:ComF family protein
LGDSINSADIEFDLIVYAPISRRRRNERGYNQAKLLAQELSQQYGKPVINALIKKRHTKTQVGLRRIDRLDNLSGAFEVKNGLELKGKKILLIDDVLTTGATLDECAKVLKSAGARQVWGAVLARE